MGRLRLFTIVLILWLLAVMCVPAGAQDKAAYGKYPVGEAARCADCHTPKNAGAPMPAYSLKEAGAAAIVPYLQPLE